MNGAPLTASAYARTVFSARSARASATQRLLATTGDFVMGPRARALSCLQASLARSVGLGILARTARRCAIERRAGSMGGAAPRVACRMLDRAQKT